MKKLFFQNMKIQQISKGPWVVQQIKFYLLLQEEEEKVI